MANKQEVITCDVVVVEDNQSVVDVDKSVEVPSTSTPTSTSSNNSASSSVVVEDPPQKFRVTQPSRGGDPQECRRMARSSSSGDSSSSSKDQQQTSGNSNSSGVSNNSGTASSSSQTNSGGKQQASAEAFSKVIADKYLLCELVEGSSLWKCVEINTQEEMVCKVVSKNSRSLVSAHFRLASNSRVSSLHEVIVGNRFLYLIYPKAHGDLHSYVRSRKRLRESEAKRLFRQIAEAVQDCHRNGIVLRDLKLRKFVFSNPQRTELKLESLEDAVVLEEPEADWLHDKRGCPAYVSPEILKAGAHYSGKAADMWSLGVILYTMLVGRYPFNDLDHSSLFAKISRGYFIIPDCLSPRARCLIRSLLRREPSERITSEDIMYHPWLNKEEREWTTRACDQLVPDCSLYDD